MRTILVNQITDRTNPDDGTDLTTPTAVNADLCRVFYPRKHDKPGTRITFGDGGGWACSDTFDEMKAKFAAVGLNFLPLTMVTEVEAVIDDETGEHLNAADEGNVPVMVNPAHMRCFYPRKDNKVGTRLTFGKGSGMAVTDLFEDVVALAA